ncbi:glycosyltransferase family 2 protein [Paenibacillus lautus]|uniref:glycosyltransferase family 2 protein n=1 Tax=Paenibacillus lautus TaxID=1401 RepID=UPI001C7D2E08|nr:glycosyltransferase family 2 protein [Paenibacillus lautus]MBX4152347.1 glycosyltransferase [Paenibacillus lautus]
MADLLRLYNSDLKESQKKKIAWELFVWYSGQYDIDTSKTALEVLPTAINKMDNSDLLRKALIIKAECQRTLNNYTDAYKTIDEALSLGEDPNVYLAFACLETTISSRINWINKSLSTNKISEISLKEDDFKSKSPLDSIKVREVHSKYNSIIDPVKVSVIMPVYNSEKVIKTAIESVLNQTWKNIELIIVDDCSVDSTVPIIEELSKNDDRIHLLKSDKNQGTYVARNIGLKYATGDFITCQDADDWAHPEKIERQAIHLIDNSFLIGNTSQTVRTTDDFFFARKGKIGQYICNNFSSLMFRRDRVENRIGFWDSVRFAADGEFIRRIRKVYGKDSIINLNTGILSFSRISKNSLTENSAFGYNGFFYGARKEYVESFSYFHDNFENLKIEFPQLVRPFAIPDPLKPNRELDRNFDVILVADYISTDDIENNIKILSGFREQGLRIGLIQMSSYNLNYSEINISKHYREIIDGGQLQVIVYGETVSCDVIVVSNSLILKEKQEYVPIVEKSNSIHVIVTHEVDSYRTETCENNLKYYFGKTGIWYPMNQKIREEISRSTKSLIKMNLSNLDWDTKHLDIYKGVNR